MENSLNGIPFIEIAYLPIPTYVIAIKYHEP